MVEVTYLDKMTGLPILRLKRLSSLVMLTQDPDGSVWIRTRKC
jgi:hypothetical protein